MPGGGPAGYGPAVIPGRRRNGPREPDLDASAPAALRDAAALLERAMADEEAAREARRRYRSSGIPAIEPEPEVRPHLLDGEQLLAVRTSALLEHAVPTDGQFGSGGRLYLTTLRLLHLGQAVFGLELTQIDEQALAGERLLLRLRDGAGIALEVPEPRLLRVQIAAALAAARA
jgi:hypothetical protein